MKNFLVIPILFLSTIVSGQKIGELAPEQPSEIFPSNSWGVDLMFGEGGFGLGTFLRKSFSEDFKGFVDFSFSESKDDKEVEYIDYFGQTYVFGKVNRVFLLPLNFGIQYRLFRKSVTDNLRPYLCLAVGPNFIMTTPYEKEFFNAFGQAKIKYALGGYIGFGADFGLSKSNLLGLNIRYSYAHLFDKGVENLQNSFRSNLAHLYITLNIGIMY
ncbi:MAG: hypothetical protein K9I69_01630 [Ignavibacteriales bacterium]|nr:hypothetical protein [Ignavibacteriales bacterium]MCF8305721.1 hypothetical protein [Ignavibacteriales bacterium]MCF8315443.1 hypothetical protein [Ignavibacteriales bacterium]MCF8437029.1 hypothetical protein [Ignavibacteriales bacterium]